MLSDLCIIHPRARGHWARHGHSCKIHLCLSLSAHSAQAVHSPAEDTQSPSSHSPNAFQLLPHSGNFCQHEVGCHKRKNSKIKIVEPKNHLKLKHLVRCLERLFQGNWCCQNLEPTPTAQYAVLSLSLIGEVLCWAGPVSFSTALLLTFGVVAQACMPRPISAVVQDPIWFVTLQNSWARTRLLPREKSHCS